MRSGRGLLEGAEALDVLDLVLEVAVGVDADFGSEGLGRAPAGGVACRGLGEHLVDLVGVNFGPQRRKVGAYLPVRG